MRDRTVTLVCLLALAFVVGLLVGERNAEERCQSEVRAPARAIQPLFI